MADKKSNEEASPAATPEKLSSPRYPSMPASPPKKVSLEDLMKWKNSITDLSLAHEIAIDEKFCFQHNPPDSSTIEGQIREVMHKAFWDVLQSKLSEDPPDYSQALILLQEIKENLLQLLLPHSQRIRLTIDEVLDLDLIEQKAEHGALDFPYYASFIIGVMATLCAPVRDEQVAELKQITGIVPLYREIFNVLNLMKLDMVNFTIAQLRPFVQQNSVTYEREKFTKLLQTQQEIGVDGLQFTKSWLARNAARVAETEKLSSATTASSSANPASMTSTAATSAVVDTNIDITDKQVFSDNRRANAVLNASYMELLEWDEEHQELPETLLVDHQRLRDMKNKFGLLTFISTILAITYGTVGEAIADITELKQKLKTQIQILTENVSHSALSEVTMSVAEQVIKEVNQCLMERGKGSMTADKQQMLKGQITSAIVMTDSAVLKLMKSRLITFIAGIVANPRNKKDFQIPPGYSVVSDELSEVSGQFLRLIAYNQMVFGSFYNDIIQVMLLEQNENENCVSTIGNS